VIVTFPDGTSVQATGSGRPDGDPRPDFALYLDECWDGVGDWEREPLEWADFGLPSDVEGARGAIRRAFERAHAGERVEIGCLGGTGRTGTVLACMAVLSGVSVEQAPTWVRTNYRPGAVETDAQHDFVLDFGARHGRR
jgi:hypothetical protein